MNKRMLTVLLLPLAYALGWAREKPLVYAQYYAPRPLNPFLCVSRWPYDSDDDDLCEAANARYYAGLREQMNQ